MGPRQTTSVIVAFFVGVSVSFFTLPLWVAFSINLAKEGGRADWLGFAGSTIGAFMTLVAALVAWFAIQQQIAAPEMAKHQSQQEAKYVGVVALAQVVHAASALLYAVRIAQAANTPTAITHWDSVVKQAFVQVEAMLNHFALRDIYSQMSIDDRLMFLMVILHLNTMTNIQKNPFGIIDRLTSLQMLQVQLENLERYLSPFDHDLWNVFERDASLPGV
ncbi:hypothetical protein [Bradyrhizobium sp. SZCCHNR1039]|nr:hypothetical protein [Bradyrhizobium sp. SZCCHNR1039]